MSALTREERIKKGQAQLRALESKHKRLGTLIAKKKRSLAALGRALAQKGPTPPPPPPEPRVLLAAINDAVPSTLDVEKDAVRAKLEALGKVFAGKLGVPAPRIHFQGEKGACRRVARAHIHTVDTWWTPRTTGKRWKARGTKAHSRGDICVNYAWLTSAVKNGRESYEALMAHEVAHMRRSTKKGGRHQTRGHGKRFDAIVTSLLGRPDPHANEHEAGGGEAGHSDEEGTAE